FALDINAGDDRYNRPQNPNLITTKEEIAGAITVEYAAGDNTGQKLSKSSTGDALLYSLLKSNGLTLVKA
ncbi:MAG: hypothetical protein KAT90_15425, partial [Gammaproteobacteria bacterium]|nr:hypothetical protein [Gammaproteobacteria bacterium]